MRNLLLFFMLLALVGGCGKSSAPLKLYFIGSNRFVSGSRTVTASDTLAARIYADDTGADPPGLTNLKITVDYSPQLTPFLYPAVLTSFQLSSVPGIAPIVYLDSTFASTALPTELLYTTVFGVRTTVGTERWTFTATDKAGNSSSRAFTIRQRRPDSVAIYHDYTLRLNLLATNGVRRFIDLKSGLAVPRFTALNQANASTLQPLLDAILLPDGSLASPDYFSGSNAAGLNTVNWPVTNRNTTRFVRTTLNDSTFVLQTDTLAYRTQYKSSTPTSIISGLTARQVYAFRLQGRPARYGLLLVSSTTSGLQLRVRVARQPL